MSDQPAQQPAQQPARQSNHRGAAGISRRKALFAGAGAAAGVAAIATGIKLTVDGDDAAAASTPATTPDVPVMLRLIDARKGAFDMYVGTEVVHVSDRGFAARVASAAHRSQH